MSDQTFPTHRETILVLSARPAVILVDACVVALAFEAWQRYPVVVVQFYLFFGVEALTFESACARH